MKKRHRVNVSKTTNLRDPREQQYNEENRLKHQDRYLFNQSTISKDKNSYKKIAAIWSHLSVEQKVAIIIFGLVGLGVITCFATVYILYPIVHGIVLANPNQPPEFLMTPTKAPIPSRFSTENKQNQALIHIIKNTKVQLNAGFRNELKSRNIEHVILAYNKQEKMIRELLPYSINHAVLEKILSEPTFSVELVPINDEQLTFGGKYNAEAKYLPNSNKILIAADTDMNKDQALITLRNEFHHAAVRATNINKQNTKDLTSSEDAMLMITPYVNTSLTVDNILSNQHAIALWEGISRLKEFETIFNNRSNSQLKFFSEEQQTKYNHHMKAATFHRPVIYREELAPSLFEAVKKSMTQLSSGQYSFECGHGKGIKICYIQAIETYSDIVVMKFNYLRSNSPRDKAKTLLLDIQEIANQLTGYDNQYKNLELSSFVQQLEPEVLQAFFPEWCKYFSSYHAVKSYCQLD